MGIEPMNSSFAGCRLTTWPPRPGKNLYPKSVPNVVPKLPSYPLLTPFIPCLTY